MITLETILERSNLNKAWRQVRRNGGSAGVGGMTVEELPVYLQRTLLKWCES
ncbi:hypothetical protein [Parasutterella excrementihominis]|uniref:hypothetical protein n=1 Tax=Parasutterella excrementihominis TaxID=487175 RepID=UPI003A94E2A5